MVVVVAAAAAAAAAAVVVVRVLTIMVMWTRMAIRKALGELDAFGSKIQG